jgi:membrane-associated phospholipid phosphatase
LASLGSLTELLRQLAELDNAAIEVAHLVRWGPLTAVFVLVSAWWVKWPLFAAAGACCDATKKRLLPAAAVCAAAAGAAAELLTFGIKLLTDRSRPPVADPSVQALVGLPDSTSFPSGHAAAAFAAATAVGMFHPRLRAPLYALAAMVALSRVYLGVHFWSDVLVGTLLGVAVGLATVLVVRRAASARRERGPSPGRAETSFARLRRSPG